MSQALDCTTLHTSHLQTKLLCQSLFWHLLKHLMTNPVPCIYLCRNWTWRGHNIRYQRSGESGPALVLVHGFGGNCE